MKIKLDPGAICPTRAHETDAGLDLYSPHRAVVPFRGSVTIHTGVHVQLPPGTVGNVESKSGLYTRCDIFCVGTVDEGYTGEILVHLLNMGGGDYEIEKGDKVAQLVIRPVRYEPVQIVDEIEGGPRGDNGFGSTGR